MTRTKQVDFGWLLFGCGVDCIVASIVYYSLFFRCLPGHGFQDSRTCLLWLSVVLWAASALIFGVIGQQSADVFGSFKQLQLNDLQTDQLSKTAFSAPQNARIGEITDRMCHILPVLAQ